MSLAPIEKKVTQHDLEALPRLDRGDVVHFFRKASTMLNLSETVMGTSIILLRRYEDGIRSRSAVPQLQTMFIRCAACLFIACKAEEDPRRLRNVINVSYSIVHPHGDVPDLDYVYWTMKASIVANEQVILRELAFNTMVRHPHPLLLNYAHALRVSSCIVEVAIAVANDSYHDKDSHLMDVSHVAAASLMIALRLMPSGIKVPSYIKTPWWHVLDMTDGDMTSMVDRLLVLYAGARELSEGQGETKTDETASKLAIDPEEALAPSSADLKLAGEPTRDTPSTAMPGGEILAHPSIGAPAAVASTSGR